MLCTHIIANAAAKVLVTGQTTNLRKVTGYQFPVTRLNAEPGGTEAAVTSYKLQVSGSMGRKFASKRIEVVFTPVTPQSGAGSATCNLNL
jgi:hypothetical protein